MKSEIVSKVVELGLERASRFFHEGSCTHIFFQPSIGPLGIKGVGDFADEAYREYARNLTTAVEAMTEEALIETRSKLEAQRPGIQGKTEIQFSVPNSVHKAIKKAADNKNLSMATIIRIIIDNNISAYYDGSQERNIQARILSDNNQGKNNVPLSIRLDGDQLFRVKELASRRGVRASKLLREMVVANIEDGEIISLRVDSSGAAKFTHES
jgi:predicted DNA-binding protein